MKYGFKIFVLWSNINVDEYEELKNVVEFSITEELERLQKTARIKVCKEYRPPLLIKIRLFLQDDNNNVLEDYEHIFKVEDMVIIDNHTREYICKSKINVPKNFNNLKEVIENLGVDVQNNINNAINISDAFCFNEIYSADELEDKINDAGIWTAWRKNTLYFRS